MNKNASGAKGAQAVKAVVLNNVVSNTKEEVAPLLLLPMAPPEKMEVRPIHNEEVKQAPKTEEKPYSTSFSYKRMSIDELTDKADRVFLLKEKYKEIRDKRKQLENFAISHDNSNAQLTLVDANGLSISTSNPLAIGKLLSDWAIDLNNHLEKTENEIRSELEKLN